MVLAMLDKQVLVLSKEEFPPAVPSKSQEIIENVNLLLYFLRKKSYDKSSSYIQSYHEFIFLMWLYFDWR